MSQGRNLHLFQGYGVELEYMIVDATSLEVKPITDKVIFDQVGAFVSDVEFAQIAWSNELVLHVIELKTNGPAEDLASLLGLFQEHIVKINNLLVPYGARLLPTGMHPQMEPFTQTKLWPHEYNVVYEAYNQIFDCRGHGWSNLQSTHLNLPFANDDEFGRLHAAIRILLPLIPALSASSPLKDGVLTGFTDTRLEVYRQNQAKIPSIAGQIIPEAVFSTAAYQEQILGKIYQEIKPYDPGGILQDEFLNSRGAIARFERQAIEIRIIDNQECPLADLAILHLVVAVLKLILAEKLCSYEVQKKWGEKELATIFLAVIKDGQATNILNQDYLSLLKYPKFSSGKAGEVWEHLLALVQESDPLPPTFFTAITHILTEGNLAERLIRVLQPNPSPEKIKEVYLKLADCLANGKMFSAELS